MPSVQLGGHKGPINAVEAALNGSVFASGSDDKTLRLWDVRQSPLRAQYCLCECFPEAIDSITFHPKDEHALYAASGNQVFVFDLRTFGASGSIIQRVPLCVINVYDADADKLGTRKPATAAASATGEETLDTDANEINTIKIHPKGDHMAIGDDKGNVVIMERNCAPGAAPQTWNISKCLSKSIHSSIIGSVAFRPNSVREVVSGGFDCVACSWDFSLGRSISTCNFASAAAAFAATESFVAPSNGGAQATGSGAPIQIVNPPFVHALQYISAGRAILVCLGDGTMRVIKSNTMATLVSVDAHRGMATCLHVLPGAQGKGEPPSADLAVTGGIDGVIRGWRLSSVLSAHLFAAPRSKKDVPLEVQVDALFHIEHGRKINAIAAIAGPSPGSMSHAVVADTSHNLTLYSELVY